MVTYSSHILYCGPQAPIILIGSSSFLQVTITTLIPLIRSIFGWIETRTVELAVLECLEKISHRLTKKGKWWLHAFSAFCIEPLSF